MPSRPRRRATALLAGLATLLGPLPLTGGGLLTPAAGQAASPAPVLVVDPLPPAPRAPAGRATTSTTTSPRASAREVQGVLSLESRPGALLTIQVDVTGAVVSGTAWNDDHAGGADLVATRYSTDADPAMSVAEVRDVRRIWDIVAEDYAPFDVNVTTRDVPQDALDRTSARDTSYGARVVVSGRSPLSTWCRCGGIAYTGAWDLVGPDHPYYSPAWVFSSPGLTTAKTLGEAASHEAGHVLGLVHDATSEGGYYRGAGPWAPVMGAGYDAPVTQWSRGDYPDASAQQDDLAVIADALGLRRDDHGDDAASATDLGLLTRHGLITTRRDVDVFRLLALGATTITVAPSSAQPDLDVRLLVTDPSGDPVAVADPPVVAVSPTLARGLGATVTVDAPLTGRVLLVHVDGSGTGDPRRPGRYDDYGSLGPYTVAARPALPLGRPLDVVRAVLPRWPVGLAHRPRTLVPRTGRAPYSFARVGGSLPPGLRLERRTGRLAGTPTRPGTYRLRVRVTDAARRAATLPVNVRVVR